MVFLTCEDFDFLPTSNWLQPECPKGGVSGHFRGPMPMWKQKWLFSILPPLILASIWSILKISFLEPAKNWQYGRQNVAYHVISCQVGNKTIKMEKLAKCPRSMQKVPFWDKLRSSIKSNRFDAQVAVWQTYGLAFMQIACMLKLRFGKICGLGSAFLEIDFEKFKDFGIWTAFLEMHTSLANQKKPLHNVEGGCMARATTQ